MYDRAVTELLDIGGGVRLAYDDRGSGRPVLLVHGVSMSRRFFERNLDPLAQRFRVVSVDLRGHGESPASEGGHTVAQYARDLHELIDRLDLQGAVAVGWSMGTMVLWDLIRQFGPGDLAGHVNVSQGPSDLKREGWELGAFSTEELFGLLEAAQDDFPGVMAEFVPSMFAAERPRRGARAARGRDAEAGRKRRHLHPARPVPARLPRGRRLLPGCRRCAPGGGTRSSSRSPPASGWPSMPRPTCTSSSTPATARCGRSPTFSTRSSATGSRRARGGPRARRVPRGGRRG